MKEVLGRPVYDLPVLVLACYEGLVIRAVSVAQVNLLPIVTLRDIVIRMRDGAYSAVGSGRCARRDCERDYRRRRDGKGAKQPLTRLDGILAPIASEPVRLIDSLLARCPY